MKIKNVKKGAKRYLGTGYLTMLLVCIIYYLFTNNQVDISFNVDDGWITSSIDSFTKYITLKTNSFVNIFLFIFAIFVSLPLEYGKDAFFLEVLEEKRPNVGRLFQNFRSNIYWKSLLVMLLRAIYNLLWTFLFIIPGIIKFFSYEQAARIARDNPELTTNEAITRSREMMDGYKAKLFLLYLSFLPWYIPAFLVSFLSVVNSWFGVVASILSLITSILIGPYFQVAKAVFYRNIVKR